MLRNMRKRYFLPEIPLFTVQTARLEERVNAAEKQKADLKNQIENFMNEEHTANGEIDRVFSPQTRVLTFRFNAH